MLPPPGGFSGAKKEPVDKKRPISSLTALLAASTRDNKNEVKAQKNVSPFDALILQAELAKTMPPSPSPEPYARPTLEDVQVAMKKARITDDDPIENEDSSDSISSSSSGEMGASAPSRLAMLSHPRPIGRERSGSLPLLLLAEQAYSSPPAPAPALSGGRARSSTFSSAARKNARTRRASDASFMPPEFSATFSSSDPGISALMKNMMGIPAILPALSSLADLRLKVIKHPPARAIYKRIIKPYPTVGLLASEADKTKGVCGQNLFVETALVRADTLGPLREDLLEGNTLARISDKVNAVFNKLKINSTSQMAGSSFRLRFVLKRFTGSAFETIPDIVIHSDPVEVFSHTVYLNGRSSQQPSPPTHTHNTANSSAALSSSPIHPQHSSLALHAHSAPAPLSLLATSIASTPSGSSAHTGTSYPSPQQLGAPETVRPVCLEILPPMGLSRGGTRVVILGYHFARSERLAIKFGDQIVPGHFHEEGTVIAIAPPQKTSGLVPVRVANDGVHFSETIPPIFFTYLSEKK